MAKLSSFVSSLVRLLTYVLPRMVDRCARWLDDFLNRQRSGTVGRWHWHEQPVCAIVLPPLVLCFAVVGPTLEAAVLLSWRPWVVLAALTFVRVSPHFFGKGAALLNWPIDALACTLILAVLALRHAVMGTPLDTLSHGLPQLNLFAPFVAVLLWSSWGADRFSLRALHGGNVQFEEEPAHPHTLASVLGRRPRQLRELFATPTSVPKTLGVLRAFGLALLETPLELLFVPALFVVLTPPPVSWPVVGGLLFVSWAGLALALYRPKSSGLRSLVRRAFFSGVAIWPSLFVLVLGFTRLCGVSYITTVLETPAAFPLLSLTLAVYCACWVADYWHNLRLSRSLLGILDQSPSATQHELTVADVRLQATLPTEPREEEAVTLTVTPHGLTGFRLQTRAEAKAESGDSPVAGTHKPRNYGHAEFFVRWFRAWSAENAADATGLELARSAMAQLDSRLRLYHLLLGGAFVLAIVVLVALRGTAEEVPNLTTSSDTPRRRDAHPTAPFDLKARIQAERGDRALIFIAASGGGSRAALHTGALLRGIAERGLLDRIATVSGVSGGAVALALFADQGGPGAFQEQGRVNQRAFYAYESSLAFPYIDAVFGGASQWRIGRGYRLGHLLAEALEEKSCRASRLSRVAGSQSVCSPEVRTLGAHSDVGFIFNTTVAGAPVPNELAAASDPGVVLAKGGAAVVRGQYGGGRLVISNVLELGADDVGFGLPQPQQQVPWLPRFFFQRIQDPSVSLSRAGALSANFPPVFANALIVHDGLPYWVTDGGATENRAAISLLLALDRAIRRLPNLAGATGQVPAGALKCTRAPAQLHGPPYPPLAVLVADAGAFGSGYSSTIPGLGAVVGAKVEIADALIGRLLAATDCRYRAKGGLGVSASYLPMADQLRNSEAFGTHWRLPRSIEVRRQRSGSGSGDTDEVDQCELRDYVRSQFSRTRPFRAVSLRPTDLAPPDLTSRLDRALGLAPSPGAETLQVEAKATQNLDDECYAAHGLGR